VSGAYSFAFGLSHGISGAYSAAIGQTQHVSGSRSIAIGVGASDSHTSWGVVPDSDACVINTSRLVLPRITSEQRTALSSLPGQMVFDTDSAKVFVNYTGTTWKALW
jgi:hypothetical protein